MRKYSQGQSFCWWQIENIPVRLNISLYTVWFKVGNSGPVIIIKINDSTFWGKRVLVVSLNWRWSVEMECKFSACSVMFREWHHLSTIGWWNQNDTGPTSRSWSQSTIDELNWQCIAVSTATFANCSTSDGTVPLLKLWNWFASVELGRPD